MARRIDTMKLINKTRYKINEDYDLPIVCLNEIQNNSKDLFEFITNIYTFGYAQGVKAQKKGRAFIR